MAFKPVKNDITGNVKVSHREEFKLIVNKNETEIWTKIQMQFKHKHTKCVRVQVANDQSLYSYQPSLTLILVWEQLTHICLSRKSETASSQLPPSLRPFRISFAMNWPPRSTPLLRDFSGLSGTNASICQFMKTG